MLVTLTIVVLCAFAVATGVAARRRGGALITPRPYNSRYADFDGARRESPRD